MRGRCELSDTQWQLIEPILRPKRRSDGRGRPCQDTREVLNGILWVLGKGAQWRELLKKYPLYQTCHRHFLQWAREGKRERILHVLAGELQTCGKLRLEEALVDASFTGATNDALLPDPPSPARGRQPSLSTMITVFVLPFVSKALRRTRANSPKGSSDTASSMPCRHDCLGTKPMITIAWVEIWSSPMARS
jgi:transposase